jgi:hypothetical protein
MKQTGLFLLLAASAVTAQAQSCPHGSPVRVTGDVPAAISYDMFTRLYPIKADVLARMAAAQQVTMIHDGTVLCTIDDDGVPSPDAVLVAGPQGRGLLAVPRCRATAAPVASQQPARAHRLR